MVVKAVKRLFSTLKRSYRPTCPILLNKKTEAFFDGSISILIENTLKKIVLLSLDLKDY